MAELLASPQVWVSDILLSTPKGSDEEQKKCIKTVAGSISYAGCNLDGGGMRWTIR